MIIVLIGYMGSGKSTIGKALSNVLNMSFLDLDNVIEAHEKKLLLIFLKTVEKFFSERKKLNY